MALTPKQQRFVAEYLIDLNATQAAIRAGYSAKTAKQIGQRLLTFVDVKAAIDAAIAKRSKSTEISADAVLQRFWSIATADANEIVEYRRTCCRYCHGRGNRYQRTQGELERDRAAHDVLVRAHQANSKEPHPGTFATMGGDGYDARKPPHPDCSECFGEGEGRTHIKDTRLLSAAAKCLYAGVKQTKEGIEAKLNDQHAALVNVARHLGMFEDVVKIKDGDLPDLTKMAPDELAALLTALRPLFAPPHLGGRGTADGA